MTWNMLNELNKVSLGAAMEGVFSTIFIKLWDIKFPHDLGFLIFSVNLIDSCLIKNVLSDIQNACLVVVHRVSHVSLPKDSVIYRTLNIYWLEFAFISQEYFLNKMHYPRFPPAALLILALAENTSRIFYVHNAVPPALSMLICQGHRESVACVFLIPQSSNKNGHPY